MNGLVMKSTGSWYDVLIDGGEVLPCRLRGQFRIHGIKSTNPVVVGDHVTVDAELAAQATRQHFAPVDENIVPAAGGFHH